MPDEMLPLVPQIGRDALQHLTPEQINAALDAGRLDAVLGRPVRVDVDALARQTGADDQEGAV